MLLLVRAWSSSRRELISSLANTLRRCHSTVRRPMNKRAAISWLARPSRASWAISSSCGVRSEPEYPRIVAEHSGALDDVPGLVEEDKPGGRRTLGVNQLVLNGPLDAF